MMEYLLGVGCRNFQFLTKEMTLAVLMANVVGYGQNPKAVPS